MDGLAQPLSVVRVVRLGLRLGLFQLSLGILGVLILGLLNRLLITEIGVSAALTALAFGAQQLMGFSRAWFGDRSDRIPPGRLRRTPFIVMSSLALSLLFGGAGWVVLQLARTMPSAEQPFFGAWMGLLTLISIAIGTAVAAGGTAFSALIVDLTTDRERPRVLSVVWGMRLLGVLLGTALVNRIFGAACGLEAGQAAVIAGLERLIVVTPLLLFGLGVLSIFGLERRDLPNQETESLDVDDQDVADNSRDGRESLTLLQLLGRLRSIPQFGRFTGALCLFTFSMFLNDAVLEPYGAAVFDMSICATTALNAFLAVGFFVGLGLSGFQLVHRIGNIRTAQFGAVFASISLALMLLSAPWQSFESLYFSLTLFGVSLGICIHASFTLMFSFVEPGRVGLLLGIWGALYAYSRGFATISGGGLLTLFETWNGGDMFGAYGGVFGLQMIGFLAAALLMHRLDVAGFRKNVQFSVGDVIQGALD